MPPRGRSVVPSARAGRGAGPLVRCLAILVLAALPATAACSERDAVALDTSGAGLQADASAATTGPADAAAPSGSTGPASAAGSASGSAPGDGAPQLLLEGDGLGVAVGTSVRHLRFGASRATMVTALTGTIGEPREQRLTECGQGMRTQLERQGLRVLVQGTRFVGWTDQGGAGRRLTTRDGIGVGSTLAQVREKYPAITLADGSLGPEFTGGHGVSGLLTGTSPASKVTAVFAGETCFFR